MNITIRKIFSLFLAFVFLFGSVPMANLGIENLFALKASAEEDEEINLIDKEELKTYGDYVYYVENNEVTIYYYMGKEINITIPSEIEGMPVRKLETYSFCHSGSLEDTSYNELFNSALQKVENVYIPDTVEYIGNRAFAQCPNLQRVRLSANLREIGAYAFSYCTKLSELRITGNKLERVGGGFLEYTPITGITFPGGEGTELTICTYAFKNSNVKSITIECEAVRLEQSCIYRGRNQAIDELIVDGVITYCELLPFGSSADVPKSPKVIILKNKPDEIIYAYCVGPYRKGYIDNYQGKGWTYFTSRAEAGWITEGEYRYFINGDKAVLTDYLGTETGTLVVPETLGGKRVAEIGHAAFRYCTAEYVKLPDTVEYVGTYAFEGSENLKRVEYNTNNEINFGMYAFIDCFSLEAVVLPANVTKVPDYIFANCMTLSTVVALGATEIGRNAFVNCSALDSVHFSDELHTVGAYAFKDCENLRSIGVSGEKITSLGSQAFDYTSLEAFTFSPELTEIPGACFRETLLTSVVIPENVEVINGSAFSGCANLESVVLPDNLKIIESSAFRYCTSLESIDFPESLVEIGNYAFEMCSNLSGEIRLEKNLVFVGKLAFGCTNLTELYYNVPDMEIRDSLRRTEAFGYVGYAGFEKITIGNDVKVLPAGVFKDQKAIEAIVIPDSVEIIGMDAFKNCTSLRNLTLPDSVTEIGVRAFEGCSSLTEFTVPKNTKTLGKSVIPVTVTTVFFNAENCELYFPDNSNVSLFANTNIENVILGDTVKRIPDYFFSGYDCKEELIIPDSVTEIGIDAFKNSSVKNVTFSEKLISIEDGAFSGSDILLSADSLPQSLRMIGENAFADCGILTEVYVPDSVVYVGEGAFASCSVLEKVRMSPNVKYLMEKTFYACPMLSAFAWEADVKLVGKETFAYCSLLSEFDFVGVEKIYPNSFTGSGVNVVMLGENKNEEATELVSIEKQSFMDCVNLETVSVGGNVATIKSAAFANCGKLETAVISPAVVNIASDAFDGCDSLTIYCVEESYAHEYALNNGIPVSTFVIDAIPNQVYTSKEIEPDVNVKVSNKNLTENTDFAVKYSDNINVGTAKVLVSGKGIYKVLASVANFTIITKNVEKIIVSPVVNQIYDGSELKPEITVTNGDKILTEGVDYTVTYKNNTEAGTATAEITGIGNYSGKTTVSFEIVEQTFWQKVASFFEMIINAIVNFFRSIFK